MSCQAAAHPAGTGAGAGAGAGRERDKLSCNSEMICAVRAVGTRTWTSTTAAVINVVPGPACFAPVPGTPRLHWGNQPGRRRSGSRK